MNKKNMWIRFLSALMILCMIVGSVTLPVFADETSEATSGEGDEEPVDVITAETLLKKTTYSSVEEKLATMELYYEAYGCKLYAQPLTGEVAIVDSTTGQVLSTNPYDAGQSSTSADTLKKLFSQLYVNFNDNSGKSSVMYSYTDCAMYDQIKIARIKGGIRLDYTIGRADARRLCPMCVEKSRWEDNLWAYIEDTNAHTKFKAFYTFFSSATAGSASVQASWEEMYPVLKDGMEIYVMAESSTNYEKNKVEEWIKAWCPHYTFEEMEYDHELTKYVASSDILPVFKMSLEYKLDANGFTVTLPANSISFNEDYYQLTSVTVLPYFGAGSSEFEGYTFVPDGSGTIIRFEDVKDTTYMFTGELYGPDNSYHTLSESYTGKAEIMRFPVFGLVEDRGYLYKLGENGEKTGELYCAHNLKTAGEKVEPTCTEDGYTVYTCDTCGEEFHDDIVPAAHKYKEEVTAPTCTEKGYSTFTCSVCGDSYVGNETEPAHDYEKKVTKPTCTERGYTTFTCKACGDSYVGDYTDPAHDYKETVIKEMKCGKTDAEMIDGESTFTCSKCGDSYTTVVYAHHNLGAGTKTGKFPKAEIEAGRKNHEYYKFVCKDCKAEVEILNHNSSTNPDTNFNHTLTTRGHEMTVIAEGDCRHYGKVIGYCKTCMEEVTIVTAPEHNYEEAVVAPTCTKGGYTTFTCKTCGYSYVGAYTNPQHSYEKTVTEPTCTSNGYTTNVCTGCGDRYVDKYTESGHSWDEGVPEDDGTTTYTCFDCLRQTKVAGYVEATKHRGSSLKENAPIPVESDYIGVIVEPTSGESSEETSGEASDVTSGETSDVTSGETSDVTSGATSGETSGATSGETSGGTGKVEADTKIPDGAYREYKTRGWVAIIEEGDTLCTITSAHGGVLHKYNSVYLSVNPRPSDKYNLADALSVGSDSAWTVTSKRKYTGNYTLRFVMLGEGKRYDANYSGMAGAYRDYLIGKGALTPLENTSADVPMTVETLGAVEELTQIASVPVYVMRPLTAFDDLKSMTEEMKSSGISNLKYRLTGYTKGGMKPVMPYGVKFEKAVGGNAGYSEFLEYAKQNGVRVFPEFDFSYMHDTAAFDGYSARKHAVKTIDDRYITKMEYNATLQIFSNTGLLAISSSTFDRFYTKTAEALRKLGFPAISAGTLGSDLNSDFDEDEPYNREDSKEFVTEVLTKMKEDSGDNVMVDGGNAYVYPYVKNILNMPLQGSEYLSTSASVPFTGMVLHGSVEYCGTPTNQASSTGVEVLRMIESGAYPYFLLCAQNTQALKENKRFSSYYSISYENWKEDMSEVYARVNTALKDLQTASFVQHELLYGERVAAEEELAADSAAGEEIIAELSEKYDAAKLAYDNARDLYRRFIAENRLVAAKNCYKNIAAKKTALSDAKKNLDSAKATYAPRTSDYDANGKYIVGKYTVTDGSIVRVTYDNGTTYILNYNNFDVTVNMGTKVITVPAFDYVSVNG